MNCINNENVFAYLNNEMRYPDESHSEDSLNTTQTLNRRLYEQNSKPSIHYSTEVNPVDIIEGFYQNERVKKILMLVGILIVLYLLWQYSCNYLSIDVISLTDTISDAVLNFDGKSIAKSLLNESDKMKSTTQYIYDEMRKGL
jgi:hypothetical protein